MPKWTRFEQAFRSSLQYENPLQAATLTVLFTSPAGQTWSVEGFWDGGRVWRVRFCPDQAGVWSFKTQCSDPLNSGLHGQSGAFLSTAAFGAMAQNRFHQHGPVAVARDHRHFEHADGSPFFWLADTAWDGARIAAPKDWFFYAQVRASQKFSVIQWSAAPGGDAQTPSAITGFPDQIGINPDFFQRLEAKVDAATQAGLLSAIVPFSDSENTPETGPPVTDDQIALLVRYLVARWGADPVVWLLPVEGEKDAPRWKQIGSKVFGNIRHAPVLVCPRSPSLAESFRDQTWVDALGLPVASPNTAPAWTAEALAAEWQKTPPRPLIPVLPIENSVVQKRILADTIREAACSSLLRLTPAGLSYGGAGVAHWDQKTGPKGDDSPGAQLPLWHKSLFLPGAKQMGWLSQAFSGLDFWRLNPDAGLLAQSSAAAPARAPVAAASEAKDLALVYLPDDHPVELAAKALPASFTATWLNLRSGELTSAAGTGQPPAFRPPAPGEWLLIVQARQ